MIWSHFNVAWEESPAAARGWTAEHGHLLAPLDATYQDHRVGIRRKNQRAAARKAADTEQRRAEGLPVKSLAGAVKERRERLEDIDPAWCPEPGARTRLVADSGPLVSVRDCERRCRRRLPG
ncbi:hypothetical protein GL259_02920 [Streptomyces sp. Tu 3180]|uniref:helicase associated domain-containing protein n=1 Tax=Streptomyces sp. enrichment culture TaxID=1795815 RepID=UPI001356ABBE|nr:hypothetical protein GL259_02920 [Streptomyces sp. Tu 3180]